MLTECSNCHEEFEQKDMMSYYAGSKTIWLCWECYLNSQKEANASDRYRQKRLHKIATGKKRNK